MLSAQSGPRLPATSSAGAGDNGVNTVHAPVNITKSTEANAGVSLPHFKGSSGTVSSCSNSDAEQVPVAAAFQPSTSSFAAAVTSSSSAMRVHVRFADDDDSVTVEKTDVSSEASLDVAAYEDGEPRSQNSEQPTGHLSKVTNDVTDYPMSGQLPPEQDDEQLPMATADQSASDVGAMDID